MNRVNRLLTPVAYVALVAGAATVRAADAPPPYRPPAPAPAPSPGPAAPGGEDAYAAGERCVDEAMKWISKGNPPAPGLQTMHAVIDYKYDDGNNHDERTMELWYRNPDAFRANFEWGGHPTTFLLVGERGFMIMDALHVRDLNTDATVGPKVMPMLKNYRAILQEVGRMVAPKSPGARFRLEGVIPNQAATGGQWYKVVRTAPREPTMTYFFGAGPRKDGSGLRAIAPDRLVIAGDPGTTYQGDEYRLEGWARDDAQSMRELARYPQRIRLYAIGIDPEDRPTMRAVVQSLELNQYMPPELLAPPY